MYDKKDIKPVSVEQLVKEAKPSLFATSRFIVFIAGSIVVAFILVVISMYAYQRSGAAQLDLSRPSYEEVRSKVQPIRVDGFESAGPVDKQSLDKFKKLYDKAASQISEKNDSFSSEPISDKELSIKVN